MVSAAQKSEEQYLQAGYFVTGGINISLLKRKQRGTTQRDKATLPFMNCKRKDGALLIGSGISPIECFFLEELSGLSQFNPNNIFVIGNAWGWSAVVLANCFPDSFILSIDACLGGTMKYEGLVASNLVKNQNNLNIQFCEARSPQDNSSVIRKYLGESSINLVFIDAEHTNEAQSNDYASVAFATNENTVFIFHDVMLFNMQDSFFSIAKSLPMYKAKILSRTTSGLGILYPKRYTEIDSITDAFCNSMDSLISLFPKKTKMALLKDLIVKFLPSLITSWLIKVKRKFV